MKRSGKLLAEAASIVPRLAESEPVLADLRKAEPAIKQSLADASRLMQNPVNEPT